MSQPRKIRCRVDAIGNHGGGVYTLELKPSGPVPAFRAGQFLHLAVDPFDPSGFWPESRVFSISSSPRERDRLRICYSVKGSYTTRMEQELCEGAEVWVKLPYGDFVIDDAADAVLIAGGTGISAFTALIESLSPAASRSVTLIYGARNADLLLFGEMLLRQHAAVPRFHLVFFTESPSEAFASRMAALPRAPLCLPGRIDPARFLPPATALCPPQARYYLSGPPVMLKTLASQLPAAGVAQDAIHTDAWE